MRSAKYHDRHVPLHTECVYSNDYDFTKFRKSMLNGDKWDITFFASRQPANVAFG